MDKKETTTFDDWLQSNRACVPAIVWKGKRSAEATYRDCAQAHWLVWWLWRAGFQAECLEVAFVAADRAVRNHAADKFEAAGLREEADRLRALSPVVDASTARAAVRQAWAAAAARAEWAAAAAREAALAEGEAAVAAASAVSWAAPDESAEHVYLCDRLRELVPWERLRGAMAALGVEA